MASNTNDQLGAPRRPNARKDAARELAGRTGMKYTEALRQVETTEGRTPRDRWILDESVRAWFAGEGWRGIGFHNLYDWLDEEVNPQFSCDWCDQDADARGEDCSIELIVASYDPDLSPVTAHLATKKYHAACRPSKVVWARQIEVPDGPFDIALPASAAPDQQPGVFELEPHPLVDVGEDGPKAVLMISARVTEDVGEGARAWLGELTQYANACGFGHPGQEGYGGETPWTLRIEDDFKGLVRQWIALRTDDDHAPDHLLIGALDLPAPWVAAARRDGQIVLALGPCTVHWEDVHGVPDELMDDLVEERITQRPPRPGTEPCGCAALSTEQLSDLVDEGAFVAGFVRVLPVSTPQAG